MEQNLKNYIKALVQLSLVDRSFIEPERSYLYNIGKAHGVSEEQINELVKQVLQEKEDSPLVFSSLSSDQRFDYLYSLVQLMKIDGEVYLAEIKFCESAAESLGYNKEVVKKMSSRVYKDPSITANREQLMKETNKFLKK